MQSPYDRQTKVLNCTWRNCLCIATQTNTARYSQCFDDMHRENWNTTGLRIFLWWFSFVLYSFYKDLTTKRCKCTKHCKYRFVLCVGLRFWGGLGLLFLAAIKEVKTVVLGVALRGKKNIQEKAGTCQTNPWKNLWRGCEGYPNINHQEDNSDTTKAAAAATTTTTTATTTTTTTTTTLCTSALPALQSTTIFKNQGLNFDCLCTSKLSTFVTLIHGWFCLPLEVHAWKALAM